jgi:hypothetical protein
MAQNFGVLANVVAGAGSLIAVAAAIRLSWKKREQWEPVEEDVPNSAQHVGGLLAAAAIGVFWYGVSVSRTVHGQDLIGYIVGFGIATVIGLIIYFLLVATYVYEKPVATSKRATRSIKIIGGFRLTDAARRSLASGDPRPSSIQDLILGSASLDQVWPRGSRAFAKVCFVLAYILLTASGTCLLACAALLISLNVAAGH